MSHQEAIELELPAVQHIVRGVAERGSVGTLAGLPEAFKSFLAMEIALKVAGGGRSVLGLDVETHGAVGFWWQDDSTEAELARLKAYAEAHGYLNDLPIRWHLNEGLRLPDYVDDLRAEVERERQVFVVLDSLYNFLPPHIKLKDEEVAQVLDRIKAEVCDPTGCAVAFVDHAPWPSESTRGAVRGYGSVFKAAAVRWGVYLERKRDADEVWIEARGNNVAGFRRKLFAWDADALEFNPVDREKLAEEDLDERVFAYVYEHPGEPTAQIEKQVKGRAIRIREALHRLRDDPRDDLLKLVSVPRTGGTGELWYPANHPEVSGLQVVPPLGTDADDLGSEPSGDGRSSRRPGVYTPDGTDDLSDGPDPVQDELATQAGYHAALVAVSENTTWQRRRGQKPQFCRPRKSLQIRNF